MFLYYHNDWVAFTVGFLLHHVSCFLMEPLEEGGSQCDGRDQAL